MYVSFESIVIFRLYNTLAAGWHQLTQLEMGVIVGVTDSEMPTFSFDINLQPHG